MYMYIICCWDSDMRKSSSMIIVESYKCIWEYVFLYKLYLYYYHYYNFFLQLLGMLIRSKSHLVNSNILHLTFTLVGTVDSEHESACIPNIIAFRDLLAGIL